MLNALPCACMDRGNVIPADVGIQVRGNLLDSRVRGNDHDAASAIC
jgi:hypothetical protein